MSESEVYDACRRLAVTFRPPLPAARFQHAVKHRRDVWRWKNKTVARLLRVTDDEAEMLEMIVPEHIRDARRRKRDAARTEKAVHRMKARVKFCELKSQDVDLLKHRTTRDVAAELGVSHTTVASWERETRGQTPEQVIAAFHRWLMQDINLMVRTGDIPKRVNWADIGRAAEAALRSHEAERDKASRQGKLAL